MSKYRCPKCSSENLAIERRPDGDSICLSCKWKGPTKELIDTNRVEKPQHAAFNLWASEQAIPEDLTKTYYFPDLKVAFIGGYFCTIRENDKLKAEINRLEKIIAKEVSDNDEFGSEFVIVNISEDEKELK